MTGPPVGLNATFCATLVDEWVRSGVTDAVVSPGSRSSPLALALAAAASERRLRLHVQLDERSAGFMALGLGLATGRAAVVVTTSGTAAVELHPAVVEAHHARVPLVACTADRPPELRDVGAPQTIDQTRLFGPAVRWFADPGPPVEELAHTWRSLASRAVIEATGPPPGPVQLNLAFREPLVASAGPLPAGRPGGRPWHDVVPAPARADHDGVASVASRLRRRIGVVVAGAGIERPEGVLVLAHTLGWPVLADPRSRCRLPDPAVVAHADAIVRAAGPELYPEVVLRLGEPPASRVLSDWVTASGATEVVVHAVGGWSDPSRTAAVTVATEPGRWCLELAAACEGHAPATPWAARWRTAQERAAAAIAGVLAGHPEPTEPAVARDVLAALPEDATLVVSSSMPVRDLEWYAEPREGVRVLANRGANGIDGVVSTAVGAALAGGPTAALVGDLAFLHDSNALLGLGRRGVDLVVVVVHNDGGGIFSFLPAADLVPAERFEQLFGTPHGVDPAALAAAHGIATTVVDARAELVPTVVEAVAARGARVVVVRTDRAANVALHRELHDAVAEAVASI